MSGLTKTLPIWFRMLIGFLLGGLMGIIMPAPASYWAAALVGILVGVLL